MNKMHHIKNEWKDLEGNRRSVTWCGKRWFAEPELQAKETEPVEQLTVEEKMNPSIHCKNCLIKKRKFMGDKYMEENNLPLIRRKRKSDA